MATRQMGRSTGRRVQHESCCVCNERQVLGSRTCGVIVQCDVRREPAAAMQTSIRDITKKLGNEARRGLAKTIGSKRSRIFV
jgi:hypothetical protein